MVTIQLMFVSCNDFIIFDSNEQVADVANTILSLVWPWPVLFLAESGILP